MMEPVISILLALIGILLMFGVVELNDNTTVSSVTREQAREYVAKKLGDVEIDEKDFTNEYEHLKKYDFDLGIMVTKFKNKVKRVVQADGEILDVITIATLDRIFFKTIADENTGESTKNAQPPFESRLVYYDMNKKELAEVGLPKNVNFDKVGLVPLKRQKYLTKTQVKKTKDKTNEYVKVVGVETVCQKCGSSNITMNPAKKEVCQNCKQEDPRNFKFDVEENVFKKIYTLPEYVFEKEHKYKWLVTYGIIGAVNLQPVFVEQKIVRYERLMVEPRSTSTSAAPVQPCFTFTHHNPKLRDEKGLTPKFAQVALERQYLGHFHVDINKIATILKSGDDILKAHEKEDEQTGEITVDEEARDEARKDVEDFLRDKIAWVVEQPYKFQESSGSTSYRSRAVCVVETSWEPEKYPELGDIASRDAGTGGVQLDRGNMRLLLRKGLEAGFMQLGNEATVEQIVNAGLISQEVMSFFKTDRNFQKLVDIARTTFVKNNPAKQKETQQKQPEQAKTEKKPTEIKPATVKPVEKKIEEVPLPTSGDKIPPEIRKCMASVYTDVDDFPDSYTEIAPMMEQLNTYIAQLSKELQDKFQSDTSIILQIGTEFEAYLNKKNPPAVKEEKPAKPVSSKEKPAKPAKPAPVTKTDEKKKIDVETVQDAIMSVFNIIDDYDKDLSGSGLEEKHIFQFVKEGVKGEYADMVTVIPSIEMDMLKKAIANLVKAGQLGKDENGRYSI